MRDVLLVAAREFRQIVATRGFWIMLLIVPLAIGASIFASAKLAPNAGVAFTMVDHSGRFAERLEERLERDHQREVLRDLAAYVERWDLAGAEPAAPWAGRGNWMVDAEVERFAEAGGAEAALERLAPALPEEAPAFEMPERLFPRVDPPAAVPAGEGPEAFGAALAPALKEDVETPDGEMPLALGIYIPENMGAPGAAARVWTHGGVDYGLLNIVREELTAGMRLDAMQADGLSADAAAQVQSLSAPIAVTEPAVGEERGFFATASIIPVALMYLLLFTSVTTGSMMLQGVVEERSNKLLESVLACVRPATLMNGKLVGLGGVGLGIILVWIGCAVVAVLAGSGGFADMLGASVEALDQPWMWAAMIFYFLAGYLILSMVFLAIGALSDSMQDAQAYLGPVLIVVMLPLMIMMQSSLRNPDGMVTQVLSWIPIYTPFAMLSRLGTGVSLVEVIGTTVLLVVFTALELLVLGRLFQASVLNAGKPGWRGILAMLKPKSAGE